jgi:hypothetical protein
MEVHAHVDTTNGRRAAEAKQPLALLRISHPRASTLLAAHLTDSSITGGSHRWRRGAGVGQTRASTTHASRSGMVRISTPAESDVPAWCSHRAFCTDQKPPSEVGEKPNAARWWSAAHAPWHMTRREGASNCTYTLICWTCPL